MSKTPNEGYKGHKGPSNRQHRSDTRRFGEPSEGGQGRRRGVPEPRPPGRRDSPGEPPPPRRRP